LALALLFVNLYVVPILHFAQRAFGELERTTALALASTRAKASRRHGYPDTRAVHASVEA
jgi:hypothetical protein